MKFKSAFSKYVRKSYIVDGKSLTKQCFKDECDINNIMKKVAKTGLVSHVSRFKGRYGDFIDATDYRTAVDKILEAECMFESLPANIRSMFSNDPASFLEFVQNPDNILQMEELGLTKPKEPDYVAPKESENVSESEEK